MQFSFRTASKSGLLLGTILFIAGAFTVAMPPEIVVHHGNTRPALFPGLTSAEVVTKGRARFYGGCLSVAGALLCLLSLHAPKPKRPT